VLKAERRLLLFRGEQLLAAYRIALGSQPEGPKERRGDGRTPEGRYVLDWRDSESSFHRGIHISYPNAQDRARAAAAGLSPGGGIMIHGLPDGLGEIGADHAAGDWTKGCIAVTNEEMDEIWQAVPNGTPIEILP
jgi:murein L,D-transpeptidase YafK